MCESNGKQRKVANAWAGDDLSVEDGPFTFEIKESKGHYEVRTAPWAYVKDLPTHLLAHIESLKE